MEQQEIAYQGDNGNIIAYESPKIYERAREIGKALIRRYPQIRRIEIVDDGYRYNIKGVVMEKPKITVNATINLTNIDEYLEKANKYVELLAEAKTLAEELASVKFEIEVSGYQA